PRRSIGRCLAEVVTRVVAPPRKLYLLVLLAAHVYESGFERLHARSRRAHRCDRSSGTASRPANTRVDRRPLPPESGLACATTNSVEIAVARSTRSSSRRSRSDGRRRLDVDGTARGGPGRRDAVGHGYAAAASTASTSSAWVSGLTLRM